MRKGAGLLRVKAPSTRSSPAVPPSPRGGGVLSSPWFPLGSGATSSLNSVSTESGTGVGVA